MRIIKHKLQEGNNFLVKLRYSFNSKNYLFHIKNLIKKIYMKLMGIFGISELKLKNELMKKINTKNYKEAMDIGNILMSKKTEDAEVLYWIAKCCFYTSQFDLAELCMCKSLKLLLNMDIKQITQEIENNVFSGIEVNSSYSVKDGGLHNIGILKHTLKSSSKTCKYITKIVPNFKKTNYFRKRELYFNTILKHKFNNLEKTSAKMVGFFKIKGVYFFIYEALEDKVQKKHIFKIIEQHNLISEIKYKEIKYIIKKMDILNSKPYISLMHKKNTHRYLLLNLSTKITSLNNYKYERQLYDIISKLTVLIIKSKIYKKIKINKHYVFCHKDLNLGNILLDVKGNKPKFIDFSSYNICIKGMDLGRIFRDFKFTFSQIDTIYLSTIEADKDNIRKVFITYKLILLWFNDLTRFNFEYIFHENILPAVNYIEKNVYF